MNTLKLWKIESKEVVFQSKIFTINKMNCFLPSKEIHNDFYSLHLHNWVNIFALTEDNRVILVKQHRIGSNIVTMEVPAGALEPSESPETGALRELEEETGYVPEKLFLMKKINVNPAIQDNYCYFYLALNCKKSKETAFDLTEELELVLKDKNELYESIFTDFMDNSLSLMCVLLSREYLSINKSL